MKEQEKNQYVFAENSENEQNDEDNFGHEDEDWRKEDHDPYPYE